MPITVVGSGTNQSKTAGTTLALGSADVAVQADDVVIAVIGSDNVTNATLPTVSSVSGGASGTWSQLTSFNSPQAASAGGIRTFIWRFVATGSGNIGSATTVTFSNSITAKATSFIVFRGADTATAPTVTGAASTGNFSTSSIAVNAGGWVIVGATTESSSVSSTTIAGTAPGTDTVAAITTTGGSSATNVGTALRAREFTSAASGVAGTASILDGGGFWLALNPSFAASGTVAVTSTVSGILAPDPTAVDIIPLSITRGSGNFTTTTPAGYALLILTNAAYTGGATVTTTVTYNSVTQVPIFTYFDKLAFLVDASPGATTVNITQTGSSNPMSYFVWAVSKQSGNLPTLYDAQTNGSYGNVSVSQDYINKGAGAALAVTDGPVDGVSANGWNLDWDQNIGATWDFLASSKEMTFTSANVSNIGFSYFGGGEVEQDSILVVTLAPAASGTQYAASGTVAATGGTSGAATLGPKPVAGMVAGVGVNSGTVTFNATVTGTVTGVGAVSGAPTKHTSATGTVSGVGVNSGTVTLRSQAGGAVVGVGVVSGTVTLRSQAAGTVGGVGTVSGAPTKLSQVTGVVSGAGINSGAVALQSQAAGVVSTVSAVSGDATVSTPSTTHPVGGVVAGTGTASGTISRNHFIWAPGSEVKRNLFPNPRPENTNFFGSTPGAMTLSNTVMSNWAIRSTRTQAGNYRLLDVLTGSFVEQGETYTMFWNFRVTEAMSGIYVYWRPNVTSSAGQVTLWNNGSLPINTIYTFNAQFTTPTGTDLSNSGIVVVNATSSIGSSFDVSRVLIQKRAGTLAQADYFDGDWPDTSRFNYVWMGLPGDTGTYSYAVELGQPVKGVSNVYGPPAPGVLVAEYGFNEGTGNTTTGNGPGAQVLTSSSFPWGSGVYGGGFGAGVTASGVWGENVPAAQSQLTHMAWFYPRSDSEGGAAWWGDSGIHLSNSTVYFRMRKSNGTSETAWFTYTLPANTWTHVAITALRDRGTTSLYINGVLTETVSFTPHSPDPNYGSPDVYWTSETLDDWRIFDGILNQSEIQTYMNKYIGAPLTVEGIVSSSSVVSGDASRGLALGTSSFATGFENDVQPFTTQTQGYAETQVLADGTSWSGGKLLRLSAPGQSHHVQTMPGEYATGTKVSSWVRLGPSATSLAGVALADPNSGNFYVITTDNRNGSGSSANLQIRNGINTTGVATGTAPITISSGIWYRIVGWFDGGFIRAELYDTNGTLQATATHTTPQNGTWTTFRAGVYGYTSASGNYEEYDDFLVGEPTIVSTTSGSVGLASPVTGVVDSVSTVSGVATKLTPATGTVVGVSAVSGATTLRRAASGTVVAVGTTSGSPTKRTSVQGVVAGVGTTSGTPSMVAVSSGTVSVVSVVSGAPIKRTSVSGAVVGVSVVSGAARLLAVAAGTVVGVSTVAGTAANTGTQSGTITAVSTVSGVLTARLAVVGAVSGVGTTSGSITSTLPISGTVQAVSVVSGAPYNQTPASGIVDSISTVSGTPTNLAPVSGGPIQGVGATSGAPTSRRPAAGAVVGVSVVSGTPVKRTSAAGTSVTVVSTVSGTPIKRTQASGAAGGVSTTAGSITQGVALSGTVVGVSDVSGEPYKSSGLVGTVIAESTVSGSVVSGSSLLAPSIDGDSTVSGTLTATLVVEGVVDSTGDVSGDLTKTTALSGTVSGLSTVVGTPTKRTRPAGTVTGTSAVSGTLTKRTRPAGSVVVVSTVSGTAAGTFTLSGAVTTESESWGEIQKTTTVSGEVESVSTVEGELTLSADVSGVVESVSETIGVFNRTRQISGTSVAQSTVSGNATPEGSLAGRVDADTNVTGSITKRAAMSGVVVGSSEVSGEFTRQQQLEGVSEAVSILEAYVGADGGAPLILAQVSGLIESISDIVGTLSRGQSVTGRVDAVSSTWATSVLPETLTMMMNGVEFAVTQGMLFLKHNGTEVPVGLGRRSQGAEVVFFEP